MNVCVCVNIHKLYAFVSCFIEGRFVNGITMRSWQHGVFCLWPIAVTSSGIRKEQLRKPRTLYIYIYIYDALKLKFQIDIMYEQWSRRTSTTRPFTDGLCFLDVCFHRLQCPFECAFPFYQLSYELTHHDCVDNARAFNIATASMIYVSKQNSLASLRSGHNNALTCCWIFHLVSPSRELSRKPNINEAGSPVGTYSELVSSYTAFP